MSFDWNKAVQELDGDEELLRELAQVFIDEKDKMFDEIHTALRNQDPDQFRRSVHTLKGAVRVFSANSVTEICQHLEKLGEEESFSGAEEALIELSGQIYNLVNELKKVLEAEEL